MSLLLAHMPAYATNGYFLPGAGYRSQGMGGVGIAYGRDSLSANTNPANIVNTGMRGDLGFGVFNPERSAAVGMPAGAPANQNGDFGFDHAVTSDSKYYIVPEMGFTMPLTERLHIGMAVVANGGMNTTYPENIFAFGSTPDDAKIGVDMMQLLVPVSVAYKVNENHAIGASLVLAETRFRAYGLGAFKAFDISFAITSDPDHLTDQGYDYSYGAGLKFGWQGEFWDDKFTLGLAYTSRTYMTKFDKYRGLFAEQGGFDIPENFGIGIAVKPVKNLVIAADVSRINYNDIASIGNRGPGSSPPGSYMNSVGDLVQLNGIPSIAAANGGTTSALELGNDQGMGFGWKNMDVFKLGVQYGVNKKLQVRGGLNYGRTPIPNDQLTFNTLAPAVVERHYSAGFTYMPNDNLEVTGMYMYVASNGQDSPRRQNIVGMADGNMHQNIWGLSFGWILDPGPVALEEYGDEDWAGINFDGWYAGFEFGQSQYRDVDATTANTRTEGWKVYSGYQFNKYLGVEGGYVNLNDMTARTGTVITNIDTDAWTLAAVVSYPLTENLSVSGKLGAAYMLSDINEKDGAQLEVRSGDDSYEPNYGVGVSYALLDNLSLRAEWERFDRKDYNIDLMTAGFAVKF
ncbi:MAG: outer membrane protein transport protein [Hylemonella sp.]|nr:outer membrane protein transport protein [Hylemonella sp.]